MSETGIRIVLASHGAQAQGMLETVQMLLGPQENMAAYCLAAEKSKDDLVAELQAEVAKYGAENIIFMTDLLYGTPFNSVTELTREHEIYHITGVNTITLMTAVMERGDEGATPESVCEAAMEAAASSIVDVRRMLAEIPFVSLWVLQRPLVCGMITGLILGDPVQGAVIGASINLVYLGFISAGGSMPADMALAGILGTAYAITGGLDAQTALAIAVPLGLLGTIVWYLRMTLDSIFVHMMDRQIAAGEFNKIPWTVCVLPELMAGVFCVIPATLAAFFGASYIQPFIEMCQGTPMQIFSVIGGLMPALGIAITLQYIFKGEARPFLFLGFMIATVSGMTLIEQGIVGLLVALIYTQVTDKIKAAPAVAAAGAGYDPDYDPDED